MKIISGYATREEAETALKAIRFNSQLEVVGVNLGLPRMTFAPEVAWVILPKATLDAQFVASDRIEREDRERFDGWVAVEFAGANINRDMIETMWIAWQAAQRCVAPT